MTTVAQFRNRKRSLNFNGTDAWADISSVAPSLVGVDYTITAWIKAPAQHHHSIVSINNSSGGNIALFMIYNNSIGLHDGAWHYATETVADGTWHHVGYAYSQSRGEADFFVDGKKVLTAAKSITVSSTDRVSIGQELDSSTAASDFFNGNMRDVAIWTKACTEGEVAHSMGGLGGSEAGLLGYWAMREGEGASLVDSSINGHNGTFNGGLLWDEEDGPTDLLIGGYLEEELEVMVDKGQRDFAVNASTYSILATITLDSKDMSWLEEDNNTAGNSVISIWFNCTDASYAYPTTFEYTRLNNDNGVMFYDIVNYVVSPTAGTFTTGWNYLEIPFSIGDYKSLGSIVWGDMNRLQLYCNRSDGDGTQTISMKDFKIIKKPGFNAQANGNVKGTEIVEDPRPPEDTLKINGFISGDFQDCDLIRRDGDPNLSNSNSTSAGRGWRCALHYAPATDYCEVVDVPNGLEGPRIFRIYDSGGGEWKAFSSNSRTFYTGKWYRTSLYARGINKTGHASVYMPYNSSNTGDIRKSISFSGTDLSTGEWVRRHVIFSPTENASGNFYLYGHHSPGTIEYAGLMIEEFDTQPSGPPPPLQEGQYISSDGIIYIIGGEFVEGVEF